MNEAALVFTLSINFCHDYEVDFLCFVKNESESNLVLFASQSYANFLGQSFKSSA